MAGSISATTAALIAVGVTAAGTGASMYESSKANGLQKQSLDNQTQATQLAESNALSTQRKNATAQNQVNQMTPNLSTIMAHAANMAQAGVGSTMLTGAGGVTGGQTLGGGGAGVAGKGAGPGAAAPGAGK